MLPLLRDALLSFLPPRYSRRFVVDPKRGTFLSGFVEAIGALFAYGTLYFRYMGQQGFLGVLGPKHGEMSQVDVAYGSVFGSGIIPFMAFLITPPAMAAFYFVLEGLVRMAAGFTHDPCASLPFWMVGAIHDRVDAVIARHRLAPPEPDRVEFGKPGDEWHVRITAVRPKRNWHDNVTIRLNSSIYELCGKTEAAEDDKPPYIYLLKRKDGVGAFRGIVEYDPFEYWKNA